MEKQRCTKGHIIPADYALKYGRCHSCGNPIDGFDRRKDHRREGERRQDHSAHWESKERRQTDRRYSA